MQGGEDGLHQKSEGLFSSRKWRKGMQAKGLNESWGGIQKGTEA